MDPLEIPADDFLWELRIAPKWNSWQDYRVGSIGLYVYYTFTEHVFYVDIQKMLQSEAVEFYNQLKETIQVPQILACKV